MQKGLKELQMLKVRLSYIEGGAQRTLEGRKLLCFTSHMRLRDAQSIEAVCIRGYHANTSLQRQTVISQFYQIDRLVVEGGKEGKQTGDRNDIIRQKDQG